MTEPVVKDAGRWGDLRPRIVSGVMMIAVGAAEIWLGGRFFAALVILLTAGMMWELAMISAPQRRMTALLLSMLGGFSLAVLALTPKLPLLGIGIEFLVLLPSLGFALTPRKERVFVVLYSAAIMVTGMALILSRFANGQSAILWLISVVVVSDVMGYFAGRILGGPKFWPAISPKKTWSGTVAGWIGASVVGFAFYLGSYGNLWVLVLSPVVCFAGQMGDIAESWLKRRAGIKDSSSLIPGHGGLLDRFDALIGATVALMLIGLFLPVPIH